MFIYFLKKYNPGKKKINFLLFGILNFFLTNVTLHLLLLFIPTLIATLISQIVNVILGCYIYGKKVFKAKKITTNIFKKYLFAAIVLWILNSLSISIIYSFGINKNIAALLVVPFLVSLSYLTYSKYIFVDK